MGKLRSLRPSPISLPLTRTLALSAKGGQKWKRQGSGCGAAERETHLDDVQDAQQTVHTVTRKNLLHHELCAVLGQTKHKTHIITMILG